MLGHYIDLALRSFRRSKALTALMVLAIGLGIGASMTTLTVFHVLSGDPIPQKSGQLFYVQLDAQGKGDYTPGEEPDEQLTRFDATTLLQEAKGQRQVMMSGGAAPVQAADGDAASLAPFFGDLRYSSADFFPMFDTPFRYGRAWVAADDEAHARVTVLSAELNDRLFGGTDSTGRTLRVDGHDLRIVGVLAPWRPVPRFYDLMSQDTYAGTDLAFLPFSTAMDLKLSRAGSTSCWGDIKGDPQGMNTPCSWIQYWVQLDNAAQVRSYRTYLDNYSDRQHSAGRFERPNNWRLRSVMEVLDFEHVVPSDVRLQLWLAFGFLAVCLLNTVGLLLAKCLRRAPEIGVRRALGASRREIFMQFVVEAGVVGLAGGALGLLLALAGLWGVRQNPAEYAKLAHLDGPMLAANFVLALIASLLAGLLPAWRACGVTPALQLKSH
jgi:putative ABC transport system permease protein